MRERIGLLLATPPLRATLLDQLAGPMRLLAQAVAERTGRARMTHGVGPWRSGDRGRAVLDVRCDSGPGRTSSPSSMKRWGSWRQAFRWIPSIVIKRPERRTAVNRGGFKRSLPQQVGLWTWE